MIVNLVGIFEMSKLIGSDEASRKPKNSEKKRFYFFWCNSKTLKMFTKYYITIFHKR